MSKQMPNSLFMVPPFTAKQVGFYQDLLRGLSSYEQLANRLIRLAEHAHAFRQFDRLKEIGEMLSNLPIKSYQAIGSYYLAVFYNKCGNGDLEKAKGLLTFAADTALPYYRGKAMLSLAAVSAHSKKPDAELYFFTETLNEALKTSGNVTICLSAFQGIAVQKAKQGYHRQALKDLENILPGIKYASAYTYFDILNSYAVELGEVGRVTEAINIARIVLASPFALAYPEWQQTAADLQVQARSYSRSMIQVGGHSNVLSMTPSSERVVESLPIQPAKVFRLAEWKEKMVKQPNDEPDENLDKMDRKDLLVKLLELTTKDDIDEEKLREVVKHAVQVMTKK
jgi:hypothetical protein